MQAQDLAAIYGVQGKQPKQYLLVLQEFILYRLQIVPAVKLRRVLQLFMQL